MTATTETLSYANHIGYSDVNPHEITRWVSDKTVEVRAMNAERDPSYKPEMVVGGFSFMCVNQNEQKWLITSKPDARVFRIRLRKNGHWYDAHGSRYVLGAKPVKYYDYNF